MYMLFRCYLFIYLFIYLNLYCTKVHAQYHEYTML